MALTVDIERFRLPPELRAGVEGKRVLISGAGKDGGLGQSFALAAGLNGAQSVGVHFHRSYVDAFDLVDALRREGVNAFPVQADVTNMGDLWAMRTHVMKQMGGLPPNLVICNSGLTEKGYQFGRALKEVEGEAPAMRRARVRQHFIENLEESRAVLDTKIDGFLAMTHLWAGEAVHQSQPLQLVFISSRQAIDPGVSVPGYSIANWAVLQLPKVLEVNLGRSAGTVAALSVLYPFVRTGMTEMYAENPRVFGRWQPRMLETHEAARAFMQLLAQPPDETTGGTYEVLVDPVEGGSEGAVEIRWRKVRIDVEADSVPWSEASPIVVA